MLLNCFTAEQGGKRAQGVLYVVSTPIGHLQDITLRALTTLHSVDLIAAEDTRHTARLLAAHRINKKMVSYHEHNEAQRSAELIGLLETGTTIALVSDAGTPMVSDPGYRLVRTALDRRIAVVPIPGVSAAITALSVAGLATDTFTFVGFPARRAGERRRQLAALAPLTHTLVFYQAPQRLPALLDELRAIMGDRPAMLAREMTKTYEEFLRGRLSTIAAQLAQRAKLKGECVLVVGGAPAPAAPAMDDLENELMAALADEQRPLSAVVQDFARQYKVPRKKIYAMALKGRRKHQAAADCVKYDEKH